MKMTVNIFTWTNFHLMFFLEHQIKHIRMISEGSCDTEDWSNDAAHSALPSQE